MDCEYRIIADYDRQVVLKFEMVNLKRRITNEMYNVVMNNDTYDDTLTVYDVNPLNNTSNNFHILYNNYKIPFLDRSYSLNY